MRARRISPGQLPGTPDPATCPHTSLIQVQGDHLFPALLFIGLWSATPLLAFISVCLDERRTAVIAIVAALVVDLTGIVSIGGVIYAIVIGPLLALSLFSLMRSRRSTHGAD